jgi:DNA replication protein DnaC
MDPQERRDAHAIITERHGASSMIATSNRGPDEWIATFTDPVRAHGCIDRFTFDAYGLVIEGRSYRERLKPSRKAGPEEGKNGK